VGLLSLGNKHPWAAVDEACRIAHGHGSYYLRCVRKLIENGNPQEQTLMPFISEHPIIRPVDEYGQWVREALTQIPLSQHVQSSQIQPLASARLSQAADSSAPELT
jgi:hypothetical protein